VKAVYVVYANKNAEIKYGGLNVVDCL